MVAVGAVGLANVVASVVQLSIRTYEWFPAVVDSLANIVAVVCFCMWLHRAYVNAVELGAPRLEMTEGEAVGSFFIPIANFFRPYQAIKQLHAASDPRTLPDAPIYREVHDGGYRQSALETVPAARWEYPFPIKLWWGLWLVKLSGRFVPGAAMSVGLRSGFGAVLWVAAGIQIADAFLAIAVIRAIDARQRERLRRLESVGPVGQASA